MNAIPDSATVVLVHGLWLNGLEMLLLGWRLRRAGFAVTRFSYPSRRADLKAHGAKLDRFVQSLDTETVHFVAHSYGGLVVLQGLACISHHRSTAPAQEHVLPGFRSVGALNIVPTMPARSLVAKARQPAPVHRPATNGGEKCRLEDTRPLAPGRIVALGSPFAGSAAAQRLARKSLGRWLLGHSRNALEYGLSGQWAGGRELGVIAGTLDLGAGRLLGSLPKPNDGTVAAAETRLAGNHKHIQLPVSHSGLLFSREVARQVCCFLKNGMFCGTSQSRNGS